MSLLLLLFLVCLENKLLSLSIQKSPIRQRNIQKFLTSNKLQSAANRQRDSDVFIYHSCGVTQFQPTRRINTIKAQAWYKESLFWLSELPPFPHPPTTLPWSSCLLRLWPTYRCASCHCFYFLHLQRYLACQ